MPRHYVKHRDTFDGQLVQVVRILGDSVNAYERRRHHVNKGCGLCSVISTVGLQGQSEKEEEEEEETENE